MHRSSPTLRTTCRAAEEFGEQLARSYPFGEGMPVTAMSAEDDVVGTQMSAHTGRDGLLADIGVAGSVDQALLMRSGQLLFRLADQDHAAVKLQELDLAQRLRHPLDPPRPRSAHIIVRPTASRSP